MSRQQQARANKPTQDVVSLGLAYDFTEKFLKHPLPIGAAKSLYEMTGDFVFFTPALANLHGAFVDGHFIDLQKDMFEPLKLYKHKFYSPMFQHLPVKPGVTDWNRTLLAVTKDQWPAVENYICGVTMLSVERKLAAKYGIQAFNILDPLAADLHTLVNSVIPVKAIGIISNTSTIAFKPDEITPFPIRLDPEPEMQRFLDAFIAGKNPLAESGK